MIAKADVFTVVLTGGIASGKTAVSDHFSSLGVPVIDTDVIARELVEPGQPALAEIADTFGSGFLTPDGRLDRVHMRQAVFANPGLRRQLESILHPRIAAEAMRRIRALEITASWSFRSIHPRKGTDGQTAFWSWTSKKSFRSSGSWRGTA